MGRLTVTAFVTLDGVMQAPGGPKEDDSGNKIFRQKRPSAMEGLFFVVLGSRRLSVADEFGFLMRPVAKGLIRGMTAAAKKSRLALVRRQAAVGILDAEVAFDLEGSIGGGLDLDGHDGSGGKGGRGL